MRQQAAFIFDDALTVMFDGLRGEHTALVILQLAIELVSQLARRASSEARIVDSSGSVAVARTDGGQIVLEGA